ncbi:MAG: hypothetical protein K2Y37_01715 [Pirellulales bacterium]|nr:hypothetical protein [Pirellulales bacterium]
MFPKLQLIWNESGATGSNIQWLMDSTSVVMTRGALLVGAVFLVIAFVEIFGRSSLRRPILATIVFLFNTIIILSLAAMCLAALYAAHGLRGN